MKTYRSVIPLVIILVGILLSPTVFADLDYGIKLQSEELHPAKSTSLAADLRQLEGRHALVQVERPLTDSDRQRLEDAGVTLLEYVPNHAYTARIDHAPSDAELASLGVRWAGRIKSDHKISPIITHMGIPDWARHEDDLVQFNVVLHSDEDLEYWADRFVADYGARLLGIIEISNCVEIRVPEQAMYALTDLDAVIWLEPGLPIPQELNNGCREITGVEVLQQAPYDLDGSGVVVSEWDGGSVAEDHPGLLGRILFTDGSQTTDHSTHVAGTVLGDGSGYIDDRYRGMAPAAQLVSNLWWTTTTELENEYGISIAFYGASIATNSWGYGVGDPATLSACESTMGNYYVVCGTIDDIVRGELGSGYINIDWSAGNDRGTASKYCGSLGWTYGTIGALATSKNIVTVGAVNSDDSTMTSFSSWGPVDDGRIKPDVVAPGCQRNGDKGVVSTSMFGGYVTKCGTSMAAPVVGGSMTLMIDQWRQTYGSDTWIPSTIKGILINTAIDLGRPGPDYSFGHGLVDVKAAVDKVMAGDGSFVQSSMMQDDLHIYDLTVPGGSERLKVTLVWDDPGAQPFNNPKLINDLDLVLVDPFSDEVHPWVLDPGFPMGNATQDEDHLNNVETVEILNPTPGLWKARVNGFNIPEGPQNYSLIFTPDGINQPGGSRAIAVFDEGDLSVDPGTGSPAEFWVTNTGGALDSMTVTISDDSGWVSIGVDTTVELDRYDSVYFSVEAFVPDSSLAYATSGVLCRAVSLSDSLVVAQNKVYVSAAPYYLMEIADLPEDTVTSPDTLSVQVPITNHSNDQDELTVVPSDQLGWVFNPPQRVVYLLPRESTSVQFSVYVPAEVPHLATNDILMTGTSAGGASDSKTLTVVSDNPIFPPALVSPSPLEYIQERSPSFEWDADGDTYTLYVAEDTNMVSVARTYTGLASTSFTMPVADSLPDGGYFWAVRRFVDGDSSSIQRYPRKLIIDNEAPVPVAPTTPVEGDYVSVDLPILQFSESARPLTGETAPEYYIIELAQDSLFTVGVQNHEPIINTAYIIPAPLADGRWYWRSRSADSAGNFSDWSSTATFVLDSEAPPLASELQPVDGAAVGGDTVMLSWTIGERPAWEESPNYFLVHLSTKADFSDYNTFIEYIYSDSVAFDSSMFTEFSTYYWRVKSLDSAGFFTNYTAGNAFTYQNRICGDVDGSDGPVDSSDLGYLVGFLFQTVGPPDPYIRGDVNCDDTVDSSDLGAMVSFLFGEGEFCCNPQ